MAIGGPGRAAQGYGGGSGGQMYQQSGGDQPKKKNMNLFDNAAANKPSFKKSNAAVGMIDSKMSDAAVITDIEELLVKPHELADQEIAVLEDFPETISEQEMITLNYSEFSDDEDASTSGDKTRYINMIINNYLKHITVFCVLVVAVSVCTFFILSYINGF